MVLVARGRWSGGLLIKNANILPSKREAVAKTSLTSRAPNFGVPTLR